MGVEPDFLTLADAARLLGVSVREFRRIRTRRPLAEYRFSDGGRPRFRRSDLDAWAEAFRREPLRPRVRPGRRRPGVCGRRSWSAILAAPLDNTHGADTLASGVLRPERGG